MISFDEAYSADLFKKQGHELIEILGNYLSEITNSAESELKTIPFYSPDEEFSIWKNDFQTPTLENPNDLFKKIIQHSIHLHSPRSVGHQVPPPLPVTALSTLVESFLNNSGAVHEMGLVLNSVEKVVTNWFSRRLGFSAEAYGIITSGGTLANLTALLTARAVNAPEEVWTQGTQSKLAIMVSEQAHYCVDRAARVMGLGEKGIIKVPTDHNFKMKTELLEPLLAQAKAEGIHVFAVVGSACTTSTGSFDNLDAIADFAEKNNIWMHIDGAHGGVATLSERYKPLVKGIERANSVIVDFHKVLLVPSLVTGVFYRNPKDSYRTFAQKASYLFADVDEDWYNSGKRTFECTKPSLVLRVYTILRTYGEQIFVDTVEYLFDLTQKFAQQIKRNPNFELAIEPQCNIVCFRYITSNVKDLNALNAKIRAKTLEEGHFYLVSTVLNGTFYLRVSLMNPLTTEKELEELLEYIEDILLVL